MTNMYTHQPERALQSAGKNLDGFHPQKMLQLLQDGSAIKIFHAAHWARLLGKILFP